MRIFDNAMFYNENGSRIYKDAKLLQVYVNFNHIPRNFVMNFLVQALSFSEAFIYSFSKLMRTFLPL